MLELCEPTPLTGALKPIDRIINQALNTNPKVLSTLLAEILRSDESVRGPILVKHFPSILKKLEEQKLSEIQNNILFDIVYILLTGISVDFIDKQPAHNIAKDIFKLKRYQKYLPETGFAIQAFICFASRMCSDLEFSEITQSKYIDENSSNKDLHIAGNIVHNTSEEKLSVENKVSKNETDVIEPVSSFNKGLRKKFTFSTSKKRKSSELIVKIVRALACILSSITLSNIERHIKNIAESACRCMTQNNNPDLQEAGCAVIAAVLSILGNQKGLHISYTPEMNDNIILYFPSPTIVGLNLLVENVDILKPYCLSIAYALSHILLSGNITLRRSSLITMAGLLSSTQSDASGEIIEYLCGRGDPYRVPVASFYNPVTRYNIISSMIYEASSAIRRATLEFLLVLWKYMKDGEDLLQCVGAYTVAPLFAPGSTECVSLWEHISKPCSTIPSWVSQLTGIQSTEKLCKSIVQYRWNELDKILDCTKKADGWIFERKTIVSKNDMDYSILSLKERQKLEEFSQFLCRLVVNGPYTNSPQVLDLKKFIDASEVYNIYSYENFVKTSFIQLGDVPHKYGRVSLSQIPMLNFKARSALATALRRIVPAIAEDRPKDRIQQKRSNHLTLSYITCAEFDAGQYVCDFLQRAKEIGQAQWPIAEYIGATLPSQLWLDWIIKEFMFDLVETDFQNLQFSGEKLKYLEHTDENILIDYLYSKSSQASEICGHVTAGLISSLVLGKLRALRRTQYLKLPICPKELSITLKSSVVLATIVFSVALGYPCCSTWEGDLTDHLDDRHIVRPVKDKQEDWNIILDGWDTNSDWSMLHSIPDSLHNLNCDLKELDTNMTNLDNQYDVSISAKEKTDKSNEYTSSKITDDAWDMLDIASPEKITYKEDDLLNMEITKPSQIISTIDPWETLCSSNNFSSDEETDRKKSFLNEISYDDNDIIEKEPIVEYSDKINQSEENSKLVPVLNEDQLVIDLFKELQDCLFVFNEKLMACTISGYIETLKIISVPIISKYSCKLLPIEVSEKLFGDILLYSDRVPEEWLIFFEKKLREGIEFPCCEVPITFSSKEPQLFTSLLNIPQGVTPKVYEIYFFSTESLRYMINNTSYRAIPNKIGNELVKRILVMSKISAPELAFLHFIIQYVTKDIGIKVFSALRWSLVIENTVLDSFDSLCLREQEYRERVLNMKPMKIPKTDEDVWKIDPNTGKKIEEVLENQSNESNISISDKNNVFKNNLLSKNYTNEIEELGEDLKTSQQILNNELISNIDDTYLKQDSTNNNNSNLNKESQQQRCPQNDVDSKNIFNMDIDNNTKTTNNSDTNNNMDISSNNTKTTNNSDTNNNMDISSNNTKTTNNSDTNNNMDISSNNTKTTDNNTSIIDNITTNIKSQDRLEITRSSDIKYSNCNNLDYDKTLVNTKQNRFNSLRGHRDIEIHSTNLESCLTESNMLSEKQYGEDSKEELTNKEKQDDLEQLDSVRFFFSFEELSQLKEESDFRRTFALHHAAGIIEKIIHTIPKHAVIEFILSYLVEEPKRIDLWTLGQPLILTDVAGSDRVILLRLLHKVANSLKPGEVNGCLIGAAITVCLLSRAEASFMPKLDSGKHLKNFRILRSICSNEFQKNLYGGEDFLNIINITNIEADIEISQITTVIEKILVRLDLQLTMTLFQIYLTSGYRYRAKELSKHLEKDILN